MTKIEFLLILIGVFVGLSYIPIRAEATKAGPGRPIRWRRDA